MQFTNAHDVIALPSALRNYGATDWATMEPPPGKREPDFTEHGVWSMDQHGRLFARDWWSRQAETDKGTDAFIQLVKKWKPLRWWNEGGTIDKALAPSVRKAMRDNRAFTILEPIGSMSNANKGLKLQAFHSLVANGMVFFPITERWAEEVIEQLIKFPGGRWDDKADVCGLIGRAIDKMFDAAPPPVDKPREILRPFSAAWVEYEQPKAPKVRYY